MPIDSNYLYQNFINTVNTFQGGWYPPASTFISVANDISYEMWDAKTETAENNEKNQDDLYPFLKTKNCIVASSNNHYGTFDDPTDYGQYSSASIAVYQGKTVGYDNLDCVTCNNKKIDEQERYELVQRYLDGIVEHDVKKIANSKWANCLSSLTKPPTLEFPKITKTSTGFKVAPRNVSVVIFNYYKEPTKATYAYTTVPGNPQTGAGDQIVYDKNNSIPFEWNVNLINEFLWRLGERFGLYTQNQYMAQFSNQMKKETK